MDSFPLTVAIGKSFCNRTTELAHLENSIQLVKHTLITSPRRNSFLRNHKNYIYFSDQVIFPKAMLEFLQPSMTGKCCFK